MALNLSKAYSPISGQTANDTAYNTDIANLFNAFSGLEGQTSTLGGLTITPSANGTTKFLVNNAAGAELFSLDTTNSYMKLKATGRFYFDGGGDTYIQESAANTLSTIVGTVELFRITGGTSTATFYGDLVIPTAKRFYFDGGGDTYIRENPADTLLFYTNNSLRLSLTTGGFFPILGSGAGSDVVYDTGTSELKYVLSSGRYKENIINYDTVSNKLMELNIVSYKIKNEDRYEIGMIAEDVVKIFPEMVVLNKENLPESITYSRLSVIALKGLQELTLRVEALEK